MYVFLRDRFRNRNEGIVERIRESFESIIENQSRVGERDFMHKAFLWYKDKILCNLDKVINSDNRFPLDTPLVSPREKIRDMLSDIRAIENFS